MQQGNGSAVSYPSFRWLRFGMGAASIALAAGIASSVAVQSASAQTIEDMEVTYRAAVGTYQDALAAQQENVTEFREVKKEIKKVQKELAQEEENLDKTTVGMYKSYPKRTSLIDMLLDCDSLDEAISCYDSYQRIERYYVESVQSFQEKREGLLELKAEIKNKRDSLANDVKIARTEVRMAQEALLDADHSDGKFMHQKQGVDNNCGATAFIVGVNTLLHENRYPDNVAVWKGAGFNGDSTTNLAYKGRMWLAANGLSDVISVDEVAGDIHTTDELRAELEQGHVVVISSGPGSIWQYADGSAVPGLFPYGHWIVFYYYKDGVFYANDSSANTKRGAGCPYTEKQMQQWLNGRSNHFAVSLAKISAE